MTSLFPRAVAVLSCLLLGLAVSGCRRAPRPGEAPTGPSLTHGTMIGEVSATSAVLWARCDRAATLSVQVEGRDDVEHTAVTAATDFTGRIGLTQLAPATRYAYRAWCSSRAHESPVDAVVGRGVFSTAPAVDVPAAVRAAWGGDVGGQNVCRDRQRGYPIFAALRERNPDFFIGLGDMIYADDSCRSLGRYGNAQIPGPPPASDLATFWAHWRYNRADLASQQLLAAVPYYAVWDDHEIRNDSGPYDDEDPERPGTHLLPIALRAFLDYQPLIPPAAEPTRLYRSVRWGRHLDVFLLDTRQDRDAVGAPDSDAHPKSMLGARQLNWLEQGLAASDATWKIIVASVPLSIPTGTVPGDSFADGGSGRGYEHEAARIFGTLRAHGIRNTVWITTDVHFATGFVLHPLAADPGWTAVEITSGPLNAGVFPRPDVDPTFGPERLFLYAPPSADSITSFDDAIGWFNFGLIDVQADGTLSIAIVDGRGETVFQHVMPAP